MSLTIRITISLLISTLLFVLFTAVSFTGLIKTLESQFYSPKILLEYQNDLKARELQLLEWDKLVNIRLESFIAQGSLNNVFSPTQSREDLQRRFQNSKLFLQSFQSGANLRILDSEITRIHFSTESLDLLNQSDFSITYKRYSEVINVPLKEQLSQALDQGILYYTETNSFLFIKRFIDKTAQVQGIVLFTLPIEDALTYLQEKNLDTYAPSFSFIDINSPVFMKNGKLDKDLLQRIEVIKKKRVLPPVQRLAISDSTGTLLLLNSNSKMLGPFKQSFYVVNQTDLELSSELKTIVLIVFYMLAFLLSFMILSLKGDSQVKLLSKVKTFQIQVIKQYLDEKEKLKVIDLKAEIQLYSEKIKTDLKKSIGKIKKKDQAFVDAYIDKSWAEILELLLVKEKNSSLDGPPLLNDWSRLEKLLQEILSRNVVNAGTFPVSKPDIGPTSRNSSKEVEGLSSSDDTEEIEELEEVLEGATQSEDSDVLEELEDADEVEDLEELTVEEDTAESVEEFEEADEVLELEAELPENEEVEELESADELTELSKANDIEEIESSEDDIEELKPLESSGEAQLEELPAQNSSSDSTLYPTSHTFDAPLMTLEAIESPESIGDLLPLNSLEIADLPVFDPRTELVSVSMEKLDECWNSVSDVFEQVDDVVSLNDSIYHTPQKADDELGLLVKTVMKEEPRVMLIEPDDDMIPVNVKREWLWSGGGIDWSHFSPVHDITDTYLALSEAAGNFESIGAVILVKKEHRWISSCSVGFSDAGKEKFNYGPEEELTQRCLENRGLHVLSAIPGRDRIVKKVFHQNDIKYIKAVICVPILYENMSSWLLLGQKKYPKDPISLLKPKN